METQMDPRAGTTAFEEVLKRFPLPVSVVTVGFDAKWLEPAGHADHPAGPDRPADILQCSQ